LHRLDQSVFVVSRFRSVQLRLAVAQPPVVYADIEHMLASGLQEISNYVVRWKSWPRTPVLQTARTSSMKAIFKFIARTLCGTELLWMG
jgi:hypothetical protein